jgi:hypothetical protein
MKAQVSTGSRVLDQYRGAGPCRIGIGRRRVQQGCGGAGLQGRCEPDVHVDCAQVRDHRVPLAAADGGDGQFGGQREPGPGRPRQWRLVEVLDQVGGLGDRAGTGPGRPGVPGDRMHVNAGAQHASPSGDHMARARVADHRRVAVLANDLVAADGRVCERAGLSWRTMGFWWPAVTARWPSAGGNWAGKSRTRPAGCRPPGRFA